MQVTPKGPAPLHENDAVITAPAPEDDCAGPFRMAGHLKAGGVMAKGLSPVSAAWSVVTGVHAFRMSQSLTVVSPDPDEARM